MSFASVNPHDPADVIGEWPAADQAEVTAAVGRAAEVAPDWAHAGGPARATALGNAANALAERAGEVTEQVIREVGKPRSEAAGEVARGIAILRYYAQVALLPDGDTLPRPAPAPC